MAGTYIDNDGGSHGAEPKRLMFFDQPKGDWHHG
jgi:hypothetical protein